MPTRIARLGPVLVLMLATAGCGTAAARWDYAPQAPASSPTGEDLAYPPMSPMASDMPGMPGMTPTPTAPPAVQNPTAAPATPVSSAVHDAAVPPVLPGSVHDIDLAFEDVPIEVAPGRTVAAWTFNGTVPGPVIHVTQGDTVRVHLTNKGTMAHSIDFHASQTAMDHQMVAVPVGGTFTYTFEADYAGVWMYHCGTAPVLLHVANGMFGMVIVDPKGGLPKVDHAYALVQSEWYLGPNGQPSDYTKASNPAAAPDYVVFNGLPNQYKDHPLAVTAGVEVRFYILDAGPNLDSSFHVIGTIFHRVIKEGVVMDAATNGGFGSQAVDLAPAQAAIADLTIPEPGMYVFVTHAFNLMQLGAAGVLQAGAK
jgi:nitrite reductase (NO-forming)